MPPKCNSKARGRSKKDDENLRYTEKKFNAPNRITNALHSDPNTIMKYPVIFARFWEGHFVAIKINKIPIGIPAKPTAGNHHWKGFW